MKQVLMFVGGFSVKVSRDIAVIEKNVDIKKEWNGMIKRVTEKSFYPR